MAWSIEKRDLLNLVLALGMGERNGVSANVLGDTARFARCDIRFANHVEQSRFTVVDMAHDRNDRGPRAHFLNLVFLVELYFTNRGMDNAGPFLALLDFETKAVFGAKALGDRFVNGLVDVGHDFQLDEIGD